MEIIKSHAAYVRMQIRPLRGTQDSTYKLSPDARRQKTTTIPAPEIAP